MCFSSFPDLRIAAWKSWGQRARLVWRSGWLGWGRSPLAWRLRPRPTRRWGGAWPSRWCSRLPPTNATSTSSTWRKRTRSPPSSSASPQEWPEWKTPSRPQQLQPPKTKRWGIFYWHFDISWQAHQAFPSKLTIKPTNRLAGFLGKSKNPRV